MGSVISTKVDDRINELLEKLAKELNVSKSWIIQQAIMQYLDRYDDYLSDIRIASIRETVSHEDVLEEYGLQDRMGHKSLQGTKRDK
jgi:predicted transcriptional regulator